jgi:HK97 family phage major capsid protein
MGNTAKDALQECVSRKIRHLLGESYERDQAIAIAYSECSGKSWDGLADAERADWLAWSESVKGAECDSKNAGERALTCIKWLGEHRVGGYGVVWGDAEHTDLHGDYFTPETNFFLPPRSLPKGERVAVSWPWLYDHAMSPLPADAVKDDDARDYILGVVDAVRLDDLGLWIEAQLKTHEEWARQVLELVNKGVLHWSSGSSSYLVSRRNDGWLKNWPIVEMSSTPAPAEPRNTRITLKHYLDGDSLREEPPVEGARRQSEPSIPSHGPTEQHEQERQMSINKNAALAMIRAYAEAERENIMAAVKQAEEGGNGENMIAEALRPLAEELAKIAGVGTDEALAVLTQFVASAVAAPEPAPEPEPSMASAGATPPETLSAQLPKLVEETVAKALRDLLPDTPQGGVLTRKNVNLNLQRDDRPPTLGGWIKAITQKRWDVLERYHTRIKAEHKALGIDPDTAGGFLVRVEHTNQIIELLRKETVVLPLCRQFPLNSSTVTIPSQTGGASVSWVGESENIPASQPTFGQKRLVAKKMAVLVQLSNELLEDSDPAIDALIREDIARAAAEEMDRVILEGTGLGGEPLGILGAGVTATALNAAPTYAALSAAIKRIEVEDVAKNPTWAWVFSPREKHALRMLEDTAGNLIFAGPGPYQQAIAGAPPATLLDYPWHTTNVIEADASSETRMFFGQWQDVVVGLRKSLEILASAEAGTAFQTDQTWIRAILRMDVVLRHPESIEVLTDVQEPA